MKKILVPVDLSGNSEAAVKYAAELAKQSGAKIYLLHVAPIPEFYVLGLDDYVLYKKEIKTAMKRIHDTALFRLHEIRDKYFSEISKVICKAILAKSVYDEILNYAETLRADLIIMGDGEKNARINIGANTERVLRLTDIPIIVVKKPASTKIRKVVFASDFGKQSVGIFKNIRDFITEPRTSIRLLYINTKSKFEEYDEVKSRIESFKKNFSNDFSIVIRAGSRIENSIARYSSSIDADLILMGHKYKKGLSQYFTSRIIEGVINLSEIPVLVVTDIKN
ncbi:MAG: universal stress protein [Ignavibacteria bacterium]|nr:universal stress protein [Ignavibacteria bacterium]